MLGEGKCRFLRNVVFKSCSKNWLCEPTRHWNDMYTRCRTSSLVMKAVCANKRRKISTVRRAVAYPTGNETSQAQGQGLHTDAIRKENEARSCRVEVDSAYDQQLHRHHPDHTNPRGRAWRDDHPENIQAVHWWCNGERGSSGVDLWRVRHTSLAPWPDRY